MSEDALPAINAPPAGDQERPNPSRMLPKTTVNTSQEYVEKAAEVVSYAMLPNPVWRVWFSGPDESDEDRRQSYYSMVKQFLTPTMALGAFITEAAEFGACASWIPPGAHEAPKGPEVGNVQDDTIFAAVSRETERVYAEHVWSKYGQNFWHLIIIARDPRKPPAPGAVRAVLEVGIHRAAVEKQPIWLVTSSENAKDMYLHFGWQLLSTTALGGHNTWCMILYPSS